MRRRPVEDLADAAEAGFVEVIEDAAQVAQRRVRVAESVVVRLGKRAKQPAPHRALVVHAVPLRGPAAVVRGVLHGRRRETAQAVGSPQLPGTHLHHLPRLLDWQ